MKTSITKGLEPDIAAEVKGAFIASLPLRKRLQSILEDKVQQHFRAQYNRSGYENANWAVMQADSMGYIRGLREVISLLDNNTKEVIADKPQGRPKKETFKPEPLV